MAETALFDEPAQPDPGFAPSRAAGLARLDAFIPRAGKTYAGQRNYDRGPGRHRNVSGLSPWLRHRALTEVEVLRATLAKHRPSAAEKFVHEVFWRTYFKGWMEQRPWVWDRACSERDDALADLARDRRLRADYEAAVEGRTGIDCMDAWARELVETGYLHNHARMWFASIWIFTLRLPWALGADFFLRHLMDGDPASNTLGWRWVAGLHTRGKNYVARASNIAKYTEGRFSPKGLATDPLPLEEAPEAKARPVPLLPDAPRGKPYALLLTEEDCAPESLPLPGRPEGAIGLLATEGRSPLPIGARAEAFAMGAVADACARVAETEGFAVAAPAAAAEWSAPLIAFARETGLTTFVTSAAPVGPTAERLRAARPALDAAGIKLCELRRDYDAEAWPHTTKGFFALKQKIPDVLEALSLA